MRKDKVQEIAERLVANRRARKEAQQLEAEDRAALIESGVEKVALANGGEVTVSTEMGTFFKKKELHHIMIAKGECKYSDYVHCHYQKEVVKVRERAPRNMSTTKSWFQAAIKDKGRWNN